MTGESSVTTATTTTVVDKTSSSSSSTTMATQSQSSSSSSSSKASSSSSKMIGGYPVELLLHRAKELVDERTAEWDINKTETDLEHRIPKFDRSEITTGALFGKGGFFNVSEIRKITLQETTIEEEKEENPQQQESSSSSSNNKNNQVNVEDVTTRLAASSLEPLHGITTKHHKKKSHHHHHNPFHRKGSRSNSRSSSRNNSDNEDDDDDLDNDDSSAIFPSSVVQDRQFMAKYCLRNGKNVRYALKTMRETCKEDPEMFVNTVVDLVIEAKFLSVVRHPNIIKMRAVSYDLFQLDSFIILDRLYDTLTHRLAIWEKKEHHGGLMKLFDFGKKHEKSFFAERLIVGYDVASALGYLHDLNIIYRDLKPDNIGFDVRGDVKLFDFGLATEFDLDKAKKNGNFRLTGDTGTIRYMAPEVAQNLFYTESADVFSFGIILWQICSLEEPYGKEITGDAIERKVVHCGYRPPIDQSWPAPLCRLLKDCFASHPRRPTMDTICNVMKTEINKLSDHQLEDEDMLDSARSAMSASDFAQNPHFWIRLAILTLALVVGFAIYEMWWTILLTFILIIMMTCSVCLAQKRNIIYFLFQQTTTGNVKKSS